MKRSNGNKRLVHKDHAGHLRSVLLDPRDPFCKCDIQKHRDPEHLEPQRAPDGWFPDVRGYEDAADLSI